MNKKLLDTAIEVFGNVKDPDTATLFFRRYFTLYGRETGEFDDPSIEALNFFEDRIENNFDAEIDAQDLVEKNSHVIPVDDAPFTIASLSEAYLNEAISGETISDRRFIEKLKAYEQSKLKKLAGRSVWDLADMKITTLHDINELDVIIDGSNPGEGFATYLLLQPAPIVKVECNFKKLLEATAKLIKL